MPSAVASRWVDDPTSRSRAQHQDGMPDAFLGPALGSLHMFFHALDRAGPASATDRTSCEAGAIEHLGVFTDTCDPGSVSARLLLGGESRQMRAGGVVIAKEAFRLVEQKPGYRVREVASYLFHAYGEPQFAPVNSTSSRPGAQHGTKEAFRLRDEHFHVPEPE